MRIDLEKFDENLTLKELKKVIKEKKEKEEQIKQKKILKIQEDFKGKYIALKDVFDKTDNFYRIDDIKFETYDTDFNFVFKLDVECVCFILGAKVFKNTKTVGEDELKSAKQITEEQFNKGKELVENYLKEVKKCTS